MRDGFSAVGRRDSRWRLPANAAAALRAADVWIVFVAAVLVRLPQLDHPAIYDEYYHALAARALLEDGSLVTNSFTYARSSGFTWTLAAFTWLFGESFPVLRLASLVSGALLVLLVYLSGRALAGRLAGGVAAGLVCFDPNAVYQAQLARFYAPHALLFFAATLALVRGIEAPRASPMVLWLGAALGGFALAHHLSYMTAIGVAAVAVALVVDRARPVRRWLAKARSRGWAALGIGAAAVLLLWLAIEPLKWVGPYRSAPTFLSPDRSNAFYYARYLGGHFPVLFAGLPLAWLAVSKRWPRAAASSALFVGTALVLHSIAGSKQPRYVFYLMPYVDVVLGVGAAAAWNPLLELVRAGLSALFPGTLPAGPPRRLVVAVAVGIAATAVIANPGYQRTLELLFADEGDWPGARYHGPPSDWSRAEGPLRELSRGVCAVVASSGVKALYHLGRLDFDLSVTLRDETYRKTEFAPDFRHKRPVIGEPDSIERVAAEYASGIVIIDDLHWRRPAFVPDATADAIEARMERLDVPEEWRLIVFRWRHPERGGACRIAPPSPAEAPSPNPTSGRPGHGRLGAAGAPPSRRARFAS